MNKIEHKSSPAANYSASSSSSSAAPQCTPLSSFTFDQAYPIYFNRDHLTANIFFHQPESESHALNRLFSRELLDELESWFVEYKIGHGTCWIDLLGLRCYDILKQMKKLLDKQKPLLQPIVQEWSTLYLIGCISLLSQEVTTESKYFFSTKQFAQKLGTIDSSVGKACSDSIAQLRNTKTNPKIRKALEEKITDLEKKWQMASKLFGRFLLLPNSRPLLTEFTLAECTNAPFLVPTTLKEREIALDNLIMSIEMHETAMREAGKKKWIGAVIPFPPNMVASLKAMRPVLGSQEKLLKASRNFFEELITFRKTIRPIAEASTEEAEQAKNGDLTYELWCEKYGMPTRGGVSQSQFIEQMAQRNVLAVTYMMFTMDYQSIMESCILQSPESDSRARHTRVRLTLQQILETKEAPTIDPQRRELYNTIEKKLLNVHQLKFFERLIDKDFESINHNALVVFELPGARDFSLFFRDTANHFLKSIQTDPLTSERSHLSQDELDFFAKVFVLAHDLEILTQHGKLATTEKSEIFPDEFLRLFTETSSDEKESSISDIDSLPTITMLNLPSSPDLEKSEPTIDAQNKMQPTDISLSLDSAPIPAPSLKQSHTMLSPHLDDTTPNQTKKNSLTDKAVGEVKRSKPLLKEQKKERKSENSFLDESTALPENVSAILNETKRRKIERILRSLGLEPLPDRGKGGHTVWRDPQHQWGQTVVPTHNEIKEGTRQSIVDQLLLKKDKS